MRDQDKLKKLLSTIKYQHLKSVADLRTDEEIVEDALSILNAQLNTK